MKKTIKTMLLVLLVAATVSLTGASPKAALAQHQPLQDRLDLIDYGSSPVIDRFSLVGFTFGVKTTEGLTSKLHLTSLVCQELAENPLILTEAIKEVIGDEVNPDFLADSYGFLSPIGEYYLREIENSLVEIAVNSIRGPITSSMPEPTPESPAKPFLIEPPNDGRIQGPASYPTPEPAPLPFPLPYPSLPAPGPSDQPY
jgi:hypothetical protein